MKLLNSSIIITVVLGGFFIFAGEAIAKRETVLEFFDKYKATKVYVAPATNESTSTDVDLDGLKKALEDALIARRSHAFEIVQSEGAANLRVDTNVIEYFWTDTDPVDMIAGLAGVGYDAMTKENYARLQAVITLTDVVRARKLWKEKLKSTITSKTLTEEEGPASSNERMAKIFIRNLFKKKEHK